MSWNIYKAQIDGLLTDLQKLNADADIVLLQEAIEEPSFTKLKPYWRFAKGYKSGSVQSGVMTLSRWPATVHCTLTHKEPWLRSPKATNIVEYALPEQLLLSINLHAINFTIGVSDFKQQLTMPPLLSERIRVQSYLPVISIPGVMNAKPYYSKH